MAILQRRMTLEEFLALPEAEPALEYEDGWVRQKAMPKGRHGWLQALLVSLINTFALPLRLAAAFPKTRVTYGGRSTVPDLIAYRWERVPRDADDEIADDFTIPPDLTVEIISPGQALADQEARCRWLVENGVAIAILVNARTKTDRWVELFRPGREPQLLMGDAPIDLEAVLPGFHLTVADLFASLRPPR